ncbi:MAG: hypothetical protein WAS23_07475 [Dokdonella sp.]|uniref:hypothetical protein n=1 Tax=Dokdonella sp. TaxID=2291710 RepID=UPI002BCC792F|nr:hypothetical protein [Dokdonella sp.]HOX72660.1 hypothetical protein [Dokdonella sp.]HPG95096.1 hypothetical protein [Dokdonella sp.]HPN80736.1 hypothetical protein [Dokdonella sp.]
MIRIAFVAALLTLGNAAWAVTSPFSFQGSLEDGGLPANGSYDLQFVVKNTAGTPLTSSITLEDVPVIGGVFTVPVDFGESIFSGSDRRLGVSVRPGASSGVFVALSPDLPINATPYALTTNSALTAAVADDVIDFAIDSIDIASNAVTTAKLQNDAVTVDKLASNSVSIASFTGGAATGAISISVGANDCNEYDLSFGGVAAGDFVLLNTDPLPDDLIITALNAPATNTLRIKACNVGATTQSVSDLSVRYVSFR